MYPQRPGVNGIKDTLSHMERLTKGAMTHPLIRKQAMRIVVYSPIGDRRSQQAGLLAYVQRAVKFIKDPVGVEALHDPVMIAAALETGKQPYGDCDDLSMYLASLMLSVGIPAHFRAVGFHGAPLSHVYVIGQKGEKLDPSRNPWQMQPGEMLTETSQLDWRM